MLDVPDTPYAQVAEQKTTRTVADIKRTLSAQLKRPGAQLEGGITFTERTFAVDKNTLKKIKKFLKANKLYNSRSKYWDTIPKKVENEAELYDGIEAIIDAVFEEFGITNRRIENTSRTRVRHQLEGFKEKLWSAPDFMIHVWKDANKSSAEPSYDNCAAPIEVKCHKRINRNGPILQIAVYGSECLRSQPGRMFLHSVAITEKVIILYRMDHCGVVYSDRVDIHADAPKFVQWILGLGSNDQDLGFDPNIQWHEERGIISIKDGPGNHKSNYISQHFLSPRYPTICGRATACLVVTNQDTDEERVMKQVWRSILREREESFLQDAKGLEGVAQMVAFEVVASTSELRGLPQPEEFVDRELVRFLFEKYGQTIENFKTIPHLLYAFRDAVAGHRNLFNVGILHRDIHINNVLHGVPMADEGNRGVLIDLGWAIRFGRTESLHGRDVRSGPRAFQSIKTLLYPEQPHTYLDDLESFFYVLLWIAIAYKDAQKPLEELPNILKGWSDEDEEVAGARKSVDMDRYDRKIKPMLLLGSIVKDLLEDLRPIVLDRYPIAYQKPQEPMSLNRWKDAAARDYKRFLSAIDDAIAKVLLKANVLEADGNDSESEDLLSEVEGSEDLPQPERQREIASDDDNGGPPTSPTVRYERIPKEAKQLALVVRDIESDVREAAQQPHEETEPGPSSLPRRSVRIKAIAAERGD